MQSPAAIGSDGKTVGINNTYEQTKYCIKIIKKAIEDAGGSLEDVIRTRVMLVDINTWKETAKAPANFSEILDLLAHLLR